MILLQLPFFALAARWIYFKKKYNYAELLTLQTLVSAQTAIIGLVIILVVVFTNGYYFSCSIYQNKSFYSFRYNVFVYAYLSFNHLHAIL